MAEMGVGSELIWSRPAARVPDNLDQMPRFALL